jgi:hypothetical protein
MTKFNEESEEIVIVSKSGARTLMPSLWMAKSYAKGIWKGSVDRIEIKTVIKVEDEEE